MKKIYLTLTVLLFMVAGATAQNRSYNIDGFRGMAWGTHLDSTIVNGKKVRFKETALPNGKVVYVIPNDNLTIGTANLQEIYYVFTENGRFTQVLMRGLKKDFSAMKYILEYKFDEPQLSREVTNGSELVWNVDDVKVSLVKFEDTDLFTCEFLTDYTLIEFKKLNEAVTDF